MPDRYKPHVLALLSLVAIAWIAGQWSAIRTENINWDEFAFLSRARASVRSGALAGAGRPGLAVLLVMPFVRDCRSAVDAIVAARMLWLAFTIVYLAGVWALLVQFGADRGRAWPGAAVGVALLALVPVFMRWSLQVRTDQPALMFAVWGAAGLLASRRRWPLALAAGILFALGYLCTQKAAYVAALAATLLAFRLNRDREERAIDWRRMGAILSAGAAGFLAAGFLYYVLLSFFFQAPKVATIEAGLSTFAYYRSVFGFRAYRVMMPTLASHGVLLTLAFVCLIISGRGPITHRAELIAGWLVVLLGCAVGAFHAAAFPYFWMTLGLFPAVAVGVSWPALLEVLGGWKRVLIAGAIPPLAIAAFQGERSIHRDTQRVQRDAMAFIERNFASDARGFQAEGALLCRADPAPFPTYFADAARLLGGPEGRGRADAFIKQFRSRPVQFMITHRLFWFPDSIQFFWDTHYVPYRDEVMVPGGRIRGRRGGALALDVIVPGRYRWIPTAPASARIEHAGRSLPPGSEVELTVGPQIFTLRDDVSSGLIVLALKDDPQPSVEEFYSVDAMRELDPLGPRFPPPPPRYLPVTASGGGSMR